MPIISVEGLSCACGGIKFNVPETGNRMICVKCRTLYEIVPREEILSRAPKEDKCRGCGAPIRWIKMSSGKAMPVNAKQQNFIILKAETGEMAKGYVPHWATCPDRDKFKHKKREGDQNA